MKRALITGYPKETGDVKINELDQCRICGNTRLISVLDLGSQPLSGRFPTKEEEKNLLRSPLQLVKCDDLSKKDACGLLQLKHTVDLGEMYGNSYGYRSGLNQTMTDHLQSIAGIIEKLIAINPGEVVLDIGSSDATLLKAYTSKNIERLGIDPAAKKYSEYYPKDIKLIADFFDANKYKSIYPDKMAKAITSIAMFYDLESPMNFVADIKNILHPEGIWVCEQSYMPKMLEMNSFDTICHEHLEYYSLKQIEWMLERNGLKLFDIDFSGINGGSFRIYVCHKDNPRAENNKRINEAREHEKKLGLETNKPYKELENRVMKIKKELCDFLTGEKSKGKKIHVYGASTKGNVLLNFFNIGNEIIEAAADRNKDKWGMVTPGTRIPIISEEESRKSKPDYYLVLPWHFRKEFLKREKEFLKTGGKFIFPLPQFEVVGQEDSF